MGKGGERSEKVGDEKVVDTFSNVHSGSECCCWSYHISRFPLVEFFGTEVNRLRNSRATNNF